MKAESKRRANALANLTARLVAHKGTPVEGPMSLAGRMLEVCTDEDYTLLERIGEDAAAAWALEALRACGGELISEEEFEDALLYVARAVAK